MSAIVSPMLIGNRSGISRVAVLKPRDMWAQLGVVMICVQGLVL